MRHTVPVQGDLQWEDQACLLCKVLETFNFSKYFPLDTSTVSILHYLMDKLEEYANKLVDPLVTDQYIKDLPLEDLKGMLKARRGQFVHPIRVAEDSSKQFINWGHSDGRMSSCITKRWPSKYGWKCWILSWSSVTFRVNPCKKNSKRDNGSSRRT